jgi:8-oxo-dGTP pyrophosphatase MutT (NUDIX family)
MILLVQRDLPYLPIPNRVELTSSILQAPADLTSTSFVIPFRNDGACLMAMNRRRGLEFSGGHVEPGESAEQAGQRETKEEVGATVTQLISLGYMRMLSEGTPPANYQYPWPLSYQQFFTGMVDWVDVYDANDECLEPVWIQPHEAADRLDEAQLTWYHEARRVLFSKKSG